jgi:hypothetical protein
LVTNQSKDAVVADFKIQGSAGRHVIDKDLPSQVLAAGETIELGYFWSELAAEADEMRTAGILHLRSGLRSATTGATWRVTSPALYFHPRRTNEGKRRYVAYDERVRQQKYKNGNFRSAIRPIPMKAGEESLGVSESVVTAEEIARLDRDDPVQF